MFLNVEDSRNVSKRGEAEDTIKEEKNDLGKKKIGTTITSNGKEHRRRMQTLMKNNWEVWTMKKTPLLNGDIMRS